MKGARVDRSLVDLGLAESLEKARALVMAGLVYSGERKIAKPGDPVPPGAPLSVRGQDHPYVSRGGLKLAHGLDHFAIDPAGLVALDIGASTGGFTDVLLRRGALKVHAVDVGHGQLAWSLRNDPRVVVQERVNARHLTVDLVPEAPGIVVCDASFISLSTVLPAALSLAAPGAHLVALIKPQFEVAKGEVGQGGVVRDPVLHDRVIGEVSGWLAGRQGWEVLGVTPSPIRGPEGNVEFLIAGRLTPRAPSVP